MTLTYTRYMRFAVPDFLTEPWHDELRAAFDALDSIVYESVILQVAGIWTNSTAYTIGKVVISPDDGLLYTAGVNHTSSPPPTTFTQEKVAHPTFWNSFAPIIATTSEALAGVEATHYMTPFTTKQAILQFIPSGSLVPQRTVFLAGSGTYTTPVGTLWLEIELVGGGGGGGGGAGVGNGTVGGTSVFGTLTAAGGNPGLNINAGQGGTATGGDINITGGGGQAGLNNINTVANASGGRGGDSVYGGGGATAYNAAGSPGGANSGGGGGGGGTDATGTLVSGGGGGAGGYCKKIIGAPLASYAYAVGAAGTGGVASAHGSAGGAGAVGSVIVTAHLGG